MERLWKDAITGYRVVSELKIQTDNLAFAEAAAKLELTADELAQEIYTLAMWIESSGNRGYSTEKLVKVCARANDILRLGVCEGIFFYGEGTRKWHLNGWAVRRNPPWLVRLCEVIGYDSAFARARVDIWHEEALGENEERERATVLREASARNHRLQNVEQLSDREVITLFLAIFDKAHPDQLFIQRDRVEAIVSQLRKMLKNSKGDF